MIKSISDSRTHQYGGNFGISSNPDIQIFKRANELEMYMLSHDLRSEIKQIIKHIENKEKVTRGTKRREFVGKIKTYSDIISPHKGDITPLRFI